MASKRNILTIVISTGLLVIAGLFLFREPIQTALFNITGEEALLPQISGTIQYGLTRFQPPLQTADDVPVTVSATGQPNLVLIGADKPIKSTQGGVTQATVFVRVPLRDLQQETGSILFHIEGKDPDGKPLQSSRESIFIGPRR